MKTLSIAAVAVFAILMGLPGLGHAQTPQALPIPGVDPAIDFPNEHEMPELMPTKRPRLSPTPRNFWRDIVS